MKSPHCVIWRRSAFLAAAAFAPALSATEPAKPNVIVIIADEWRWDALGYMGNPVVRTPNLDRLARESANLVNHYCVSPLCSPSRVSFFTATYVHRNAAYDNAERHFIDAAHCVFLPELKRNGYALGQAGKNDTWQDSVVSAMFDDWQEYRHQGKERGEITAKDREVKTFLKHDPRGGDFEKAGMMLEGLIPAAAPFRPEEWPTHRLTDDALRFIETRHGQPFFLHLSYPEPHWPQVVPEPYYSMYDIKDIPDLEGANIDWTGHPFKHFVQSRAVGNDRYTMDQRKKILAIYYGQMTFIDREIGRLTDYLRAHGLYDNSIILFTSDHGDFGGRYGLVAKTGGFYEPLIRIPLLLHIPGLAPGRYEANTSNIDVMPTVFDALHLPEPAGIQGQSFLSVLTGRTSTHRDAIFAEVGSLGEPPPPVPMDKFDDYAARQAARKGMFWFLAYTGRGRAAMIKRGGWKYTYYTGDTAELYNLADDPLELKNLIDDPRYSTKRTELSGALLEWFLTETVTGR